MFSVPPHPKVSSLGGKRGFKMPRDIVDEFPSPSDDDVITLIKPQDIMEEFSALRCVEANNLPRALQEVTSLNTMLNGVVLEEFLRRYLHHFPLGNTPLKESVIESYFRVAFDERALRLCRDLLKIYLDHGVKPIGLNEAGELLWPKEPHEPHKFEFRVRKHLRDGMLYQMQSLRLWSLQHTYRKDKIVAYHIWAGPALVQFEKLLYREMRLKQLQDFFQKFGTASFASTAAPVAPASVATSNPALLP